MLGEGLVFACLRSIPFPHSLAGCFPKSPTNRFRPHSATKHKTQLVAPKANLFLKSSSWKSSAAGLPMLRAFSRAISRRGWRGSNAFSPRFYKAIGARPSTQEAARHNQPRTPLAESLCRQLAASVQQACSVFDLQTRMTSGRRNDESNPDCTAGGERTAGHRDSDQGVRGWIMASRSGSRAAHPDALIEVRVKMRLLPPAPA